jgi:hypoxanthine phosphoribosyltransferase
VNKPGKLKLDIKADYVGVDIDDVFIIGYGMDWDERFRGLR